MLKNLGLKPGGEVLISAIQVADFVNMIRLAGFKPVVVDLLPDSTLDFEDLERKINGNSALLLITHLFGYATDMEKVAAIAKSHHLPFIEDCSQALSAQYHGRPLGSFGRAAIFSLSLLKPVCTLLGGMVVSSDAVLLDKLRQESLKLAKARKGPLVLEAVKNIMIKTAVSPGPFRFFVFPLIRLFMPCGDFFSKYQKANKTVVLRRCMPENFLVKFSWQQAVLGLGQLKTLEEREHDRIRCGTYLYEKLRPHPHISLPPLTMPGQDCFWLFPVLVKNTDRLKRYLGGKGIDSSKFLLSLLCAERSFAQYGFESRSARYVKEHTLFIPMYPGLGREPLERMARVMEKYTDEDEERASDGKIRWGFHKIFPAPVNRSLIKAFATFLCSLMATKILNRPSKRGPLFVTWLATYECNVFCSFCSTHSLKKQFPETVGLERIREIAGEIIKAKTYTVGFTGGEVLLWPHLFEIIKILKEHHIIVYIVTNGLLLREKADAIMESRVDYIVVSIDSDIADEHDRLRNCPGLHEKLTEGIKYLKMHRKNGKPLIKSTTIISRQSLPVLERIVGNLRSLVDVTSVQPIVGGYAFGPHGKSETNLEPLMFQCGEENVVRGFFGEIARHHNDFNNDYFKGIPRYWFHKEALAQKINCWSPFLRLQILPNGDVFHCTADVHYPSIGNLHHASLQEIWNSAEMMRQREEIRWHKNGCICWSQDASFNALLSRMPCPKIKSRFEKKRGPAGDVRLLRH